MTDHDSQIEAQKIEVTPAFPFIWDDDCEPHHVVPGINIRQYMMTRIIAGMIANPNINPMELDGIFTDEKFPLHKTCQEKLNNLVYIAEELTQKIIKSEWE